ncbi:unnamed protein product [Rangifer tarandus platyrhynchus]|uniref:Uncharacterized protein n=1 Tax=Rangifer tarandus platyrhynchus TaxID=3082113 RepID=A0AC59Z0B3_RANTA
MRGRGDVRSGRGRVVLPQSPDPGDSPCQGPRPSLSPDLTCDLPVTLRPAPAPHHLHRLQATSRVSATGIGPCADPIWPSEDSGWVGGEPWHPAHGPMLECDHPASPPDRPAPPRPNLGPAPPRLPSTIGGRDRRFPGRVGGERPGGGDESEMDGQPANESVQPP